MKNIRFATVSLAYSAIALSAIALTGMIAVAAVPAASNQSAPAAAASTAKVERGKYLVNIMGCHDCHTPLKMGANGPEFDMSRALTGHPQDLKMPPAPALPAGPWAWMGAITNTAFNGPWGTSFTMNLTPDKETGLGDWTEEQFIATMRTGKHQGKGRPVLPPMPFFNLGHLTDGDISSLFAYLRSLPPTHNRIPQPIDPPEARQ